MMNCAEFIVKYLEKEGVEYCFGLCGHSTVAMLDALSKSSKIKYVSFRHEQLAAHAADAYFRATHKIGALLLHVGPGLTNAVAGVVNAAMDSSPIIVISANAPTYHSGIGALQDIMFYSDMSQIDLYKPFVKRAWKIGNSGQLVNTLSNAFSLAFSGKPGPVLLDIPMDILSETINAKIPDPKKHKPTGKRILGDVKEIEKCAELLIQARKAMIYAGGGVILSEGCNELVELAELLNIPVSTSMFGKGVIPEDHYLSLGITGVGGTRPANKVANKADCILTVGTHFEEWNSSSWNANHTFAIPPTKLIQIDIDAKEIGRIYPVECGIVGDAKAIIQHLIGLVKKNKTLQKKTGVAWINSVQKVKKEWIKEISKDRDSNASPIHPSRLIQSTRRIMPRDSIIVTDVSWSKNCVAQQYPIFEPMTHITAGNHFGTMGFSTSAAIGVKLGKKNKKVICLVGDGGFSSTYQALATAKEIDIAVIWVILNNYEYAGITTIMEAAYGKSFGTFFRSEKTKKPFNPDFVKVAEANGIEGARVHKPVEYEKVLRKAIRLNKSYVIDVIIDPNAKPIIPGYWDIYDRILNKEHRRNDGDRG